MKLVSWNVNGLRACIAKGFYESVALLEPDILCLQETKLSPDAPHPELDGYYPFYLDAEKKGYSGTAVFTRNKPISASYGIGIPEHDHEGRVITLRYPEYTLVNVYTPNAQKGLTRLDYRMEWDRVFRDYLVKLSSENHVIICGDLNVAHREIDLKNPASNRNNAGFTDMERDSFSALLSAGFLDTFRYFYPDTKDCYSWWSYMFHAREHNAGWRIDYFLVSADMADSLSDAKIHSEIFGSDHCPVELLLTSGYDS